MAVDDSFRWLEEEFSRAGGPAVLICDVAPFAEDVDMAYLRTALERFLDARGKGDVKAIISSTAGDFNAAHRGEVLFFNLGTSGRGRSASSERHFVSPADEHAMDQYTTLFSTQRRAFLEL